MLIGFIMVPLTIGYLNPTQYGIWITISSIIGWFGFFDIGLGNGLRNKLTEALAKHDVQLAKTYVSTTYFLISLISALVFLVFLFINYFLNWNTILNTQEVSNLDLSLLALFTFGFFFLRLVVQLISVVFYANQKPAFNGFIELGGNILSLGVIYLLTLFTKGSLLYVGITLSFMPVFALGLGNLIFFKTHFKAIAPSVKCINLQHTKDLVNLGIQFFILKITAIIIYSTNSFLIAQLFGPAEVTPYHIANKYLGVITMLLSILLIPLWSAFTESYHKNDFEWINRIFKKMLVVWSILAAALLAMVMVSKIVYNFWVGDKVVISFTLSLFIAIYLVIQNWNSLLGTLINGVGKIRFQLYMSIFIAVFDIPLCLLFAKYLKMGITGIILGNIVTLLPGSILIFYQTRLIIKNMEYGIWAK
jgi:O-antigen/teichoic acid export membrane protein